MSHEHQLKLIEDAESLTAGLLLTIYGKPQFLPLLGHAAAPLSYSASPQKSSWSAHMAVTPFAAELILLSGTGR